MSLDAASTLSAERWALMHRIERAAWDVTRALNGPEPLLSTRDLAEYLDVPVSTLYAWRHRREGPPGFRVGRHIRYRPSDVEDWIRSQLHDGDGLLLS